MQIEHTETATQTVHDDQQKPVVPRDEAEIWMQDFRQRLNNCSEAERQAFLREHSARAFRGQVLAAELAASEKLCGLYATALGRRKAHLRPRKLTATQLN